MEVKKTRNAELIKELLDDETLHSVTSEDGTDPSSFEPDVYASTWLALVDDEETIRGFMVLIPTGRVTASIHVIIRPEFWGDSKTNVALGKLSVAYAFDHGIRKLTAEIPTEDIEVLRYAQRVGFKREGINRSSFLRNGELLDQTYVGMVAPMST